MELVKNKEVFSKNYKLENIKTKLFIGFKFDYPITDEYKLYPI
jgi:hypothetical protein